MVTVTMPDTQVLNVDVDEDSLGTPLTDTSFLTSVTTEEKTTTLVREEAMEQQAKKIQRCCRRQRHGRRR